MIHELAAFVAGTITGLVLTCLLAYGWWVSVALERDEP